MENIENFHNHLNAAIAFHNDEVMNLRRLVLRACAELETVEYENENEAPISPSELNAGFDVTDKMVDKFLDFAARSSYLRHPDVPYHGTVNGDSEEQWVRRYTKAVLKAALTPNLKLTGGLTAESEKTNE